MELDSDPLVYLGASQFICSSGRPSGGPLIDFPTLVPCWTSEILGPD